MARREAEAENHWPGFVDVLSTIVMVVTFLLIILGIVIFVISKNISTELAKAAQQVEEAQKALDEAQDKAKQAEAQAEKAQAQNKAQAPALNQAQLQAQDQAKVQDSDKSRKNSANSIKSSASFRTQFSEELTQNNEIESDDKLSVRTRQTDATKQIVVSTTEQETDIRKVKVISSTAVLSLLFKGGVKISKEASGEVQNYLKSTRELDKSGKYEVRAFFNTRNGSISEARRFAYYRALATRNQLLTLGVEAKNIAIKVGDSERIEDAGKVSIYMK